MPSIQLGFTILGIVFCSAMLGMLIGRALPAHHVSADMKGTVSLALGVIGTLSALVIGLLMAGGSSSFNTKRQEVMRISADLIQIDRLMRRYGPEADGLRALLGQYTEAKIQDLFGGGRGTPPDTQNLKTVGLLEEVQEKMLALKPGNDTQHWLQSQALQLSSEVASTRWLLFEASATSAIPFPFLVLVVLWLAILFTGFGLFAPRNPTAIAALFLCAVAVSGAILMTLDFERPFRGMLRISDAPMRNALQEIGR
jgi:hypothetical protein